MLEPQGDPIPGRRSRGWLLAISSGLASLLLVVMLGGISLFWEPEADGLVFVIPAGAAAVLEHPTIDTAIEIPTDIRFGPDDTARITVRNEDSTMNRAGPWLIGPGQTYTATFDKAGTYQFDCTVDPAESVTVTVTE
jgi:hypothetical protein